MKKSFIVIYIILTLILLKLILTFSINAKFIENYNKGIYSEKDVKKLLTFNITESYIAHYNYGNVLYQNGDYQGAIEEYQRALQLNPPKKDKECAIRINLALAMLKQINEKDTSEANKTRTLQILADAKDVLCEDGCAHKKDNNGHSKEAERLKAEIEAKEKELNKKENQNDDNTNSDNKEKDDNDKQEQTKQQKIEAELKDGQKVALEYREKSQKPIQNVNSQDIYKGKKW